MIDLGGLGDLGFVVAAYGVILGGVGLYTVSLARRLRDARRTAEAPRTGVAPPSTPPADPGT